MAQGQKNNDETKEGQCTGKGEHRNYRCNVVNSHALGYYISKLPHYWIGQNDGKSAREYRALERCGRWHSSIGFIIVEGGNQLRRHSDYMVPKETFDRSLTSTPLSL